MSKKREPNKLVLDWIDQSALNAIQMSEDEDFRQLVASRATNWGKGIQARVEERIRIAEKEKRERASSLEINW
ncbi:hypothetical protein [Psychrobacter immobilis]|uniref:hypothetical protein n=1 Tax=Psychrobacter immobilis TaxID=498 RepID=UPI003FCF1713